MNDRVQQIAADLRKPESRAVDVRDWIAEALDLLNEAAAPSGGGSDKQPRGVVLPPDTVLAYGPESGGGSESGTALETADERPLLGLATTRELLEEVAVRMEVTQNSLKGSDLGRLCREALANLDGGVLNYRTVGPFEEPVSSPSTDEALRQLQNVMREYPPDWEAVSPPSPDSCETCGSKDVVCFAGVAYGHEEARGHPFNGGPESPPLQEGGGLRQVVTREDFREAWAAVCTKYEETQVENRRLQTALDEVRGTLVRSERDLLLAMDQRDRAQEDRDKYRTALEAIDDLLMNAEAPLQSCDAAGNPACSHVLYALKYIGDARRALAAHEDTNG